MHFLKIIFQLRTTEKLRGKEEIQTSTDQFHRSHSATPVGDERGVNPNACVFFAHDGERLTGWTTTRPPISVCLCGSLIV